MIGLDPMSYDRERLASYEAGSEFEAVIYFYTWPRAALSAGKLQMSNPKRQSQILELASGLGLPVYTRPSGGRLVLHGGDICYTFISSLQNPNWGGSLRDSFSKISSYINSLLTQIPELARYFQQGLIYKSQCQPSLQKTYSPIKTLDCFNESVSGELVILDQGVAHKITGAAQAMASRAFIQQGSIRLNHQKPSDLDSKILLEDFQGSPFDLELISKRLNQLANKSAVDALGSPSTSSLLLHPTISHE